MAPAPRLGCRGPAPSGPTQNSSSAVLPGVLLLGCGARCGLLLGVLAPCTPRGVAPCSTGCALAAGPSSLHQDAKARQSRSEEDRGHAHRPGASPKASRHPERAEAPSFPPCPRGRQHIFTKEGTGFPKAALGAAHSPPTRPSCKRPAPQFQQLWLRPATTAHPQAEKQAEERQTAASREREEALPARLVAVETTACDPGLDASLLHPSTSPPPPRPHAASAQSGCKAWFTLDTKAGRGERDEQAPGAGS